MATNASFTVLGSGASSGVPFLGCVLEDPRGVPSCCAVCRDAHDNPLGPNRRGNVSCALRFQRPDGGGEFNVVVDCGKTFRDTVARVWLRLEPPLRRMDALLLSHAHADAFMGLDCLREVSPSSKAPLHVYCHEPTYRRVCLAFPYLVPKEDAQRAAGCGGGGDGPSTGSSASTAATTFIASLVFHVISPWVPFELVGSGGLVVTPVPVEHMNNLGCPHFPFEDSCLAFEFGCVLQRGGEGAGEGGGALAGAPPAPLQWDAALLPRRGEPLPLDGRGLPVLPAWAGDRVLWVSDLRALSAEARAFFAARPVSLLFVDALGLRDYPTHFSLAQALACAADLVGPGSATAAAVAAAAARTPLCLFVGMNHDLDYVSENARLAAWAPGARVVRPACGREPLSWGDGGDALGFVPALARDGQALPVTIAQGVASLAALRAEVDALRAEAAALAGSADGEDYAARARRQWGETGDKGLDAATAAAAAGGRPLPAEEAAGQHGPRVHLRWRETYLACLPPEFPEYAKSPSAAVRGAWSFRLRE